MNQNENQINPQPEAEENQKEQKTAVVAIVGRPSAGKSTFLNTASGEKISIVSPVPQTTRNAVKGIVNTSYGQLVFIDTPGYHNSDKKLNLKLKAIAEEQLGDADLILYLIDASRDCGEEELAIADLLTAFKEKCVIAINKCDLPESKPARVRTFLQKYFGALPAERIVEISAQKDTGINDVLLQLYNLAPAGEGLYPEEFYTDQEVDFRIAEIIREQAMNCLYEELPHALYVEIADLEQRKNGKELWVRAFIVVERESQKGMVIGKGASMIKHIRIESIKQMRRIFDWRINLDLQVKVNKNWRQKDPVLLKILK
ncbi:MAG: GTPase Era [Treponemataceae bacterium]|nr:GTPase Era [Treponemataceae bacterium]